MVGITGEAPVDFVSFVPVVVLATLVGAIDRRNERLFNDRRGRIFPRAFMGVYANVLC